MSRWYVWDRDTNEVRPAADVREAEQRFEEDGRRLALFVEGDVRVSTVFLGLDHGRGQGPPVLWETLVFGGPLADSCERYHTREEALAGHEEMVRRVKESETT